ncbi:peptidylprolyl isomerase [Neptuniibacter sp. PT8_73]|uniref:peptidylprolyl isomerase n=1 Tax=unclassified Neptuniibacter TaxID=2630693 RepID=UPI0039F6EC66
MNKIKGLVVSLVVLPLVVACGEADKTTPAQSSSVEAMDAQFKSYLKLKRIAENDEKRIKRAQDEYNRQEKMAAAISSEALLDKDLIDAELNELRKQMLMSRYFEKFLQTAVTDDKLQNYYASHIDQYQSTQVKAAHILFRVGNKMSEAERQSVLTSAHEVYSKLETGEDFAELAKLYSQDSVSGKKGGELGWMKEGAVDKAFSQTLFSLKPGEYSKPVATTFGFHIIKALEGPQTIKKPFEAVKGEIRYQLRQEAKNAEVERLLAKSN